MLLGLPVAGLAFSSHAAAGAGSATYTDPTEKVAGPDVTTVEVSDDGSGKTTFVATVPNRPSLTDRDAIQAFFDTDKNTATGGSGYDYEVAWIAGHQLLMHWGGSQFAEVKAASFIASYKDGKAMFSVDKVDFGGSTSFAFVITTTGDGGDSLADRAPDGNAAWVYPIGTPAPPPSASPPPGSPPAGGKRPRLATVKPKLARAVAGKPFTVAMIVTDATTRKGVKGKLTCQATLSGKALKVSKRSVATNGKASCTWRLPVSAGAKALRGSLTVTYRGVKASRSFSVKVF